MSTHEGERPVGDCVFCGRMVMESEQAAYMAPAHEDCYDKAQEYADDQDGELETEDE